MADAAKPRLPRLSRPHTQSFRVWTAWRAVRAVAVFFLATFLLFLLIQALPGDAATVAAGKHGSEVVESTRKMMGLDRPVLVRYFSWLSGFFTGDLGRSLVTGRPVADTLNTPVLSSLTVCVIVMGLILLITVPAGIYIGAKPGVADRCLSGASVTVSALPEFVTAIFFLAVFCQWLGWLPVLSIPRGGETVWDYPICLWMPTLCLWVICSASLLRRVRSLIATHANSPYIKDARLAGLSTPRILFFHLLPAASHGIAQLLAQTVPYLLGGTMVVETVTSFPGLGFTLVNAVQARETPVVMGIGALLICCTLVCYTAADLLGKHQERVSAVI